MLSLKHGRLVLNRVRVGVLVGPPIAEVILGVIKHLASLLGVRIWLTGVSRNNRGIVEEAEDPATMLGKNDLLFGALDNGGKLGLVRFLELLARLDPGQKQDNVRMDYQWR